MAGNTTSKRVWAYQTAVGTEAIDDASDTTYLLGIKPNDKLQTPRVVMDLEAYYAYNSRKPTTVPIDPSYQTFTTPFYPTTAQYLIWMLKQVVEDDGGENIHEVTILDTGLPLPLTIRDELLGGTIDRLFQAVDCYCIGLTCTATIGDTFLVEPEWAFGRLEDKRGQWIFDDTLAAVNAGAKTLTLTTTGGTLNQYAGWLVYVDSGTGENEELTIASNTAATPTVLTVTTTPTCVATDTIKVFDKERPVLTTAPVMPGESAVNGYPLGPQVYWDVGDKNTAVPEIWQVMWQMKQNYKQHLDSDSKYATTYLYKHIPITLTIQMVCEKHKIVYDYIDRKVNQVNVTVFKPNTSYYIQHKFYNMRIIDWKETGKADEGHYNAIILAKADYCIGEFTIESQSNWSTHYKTVS